MNSSNNSTGASQGDVVGGGSAPRRTVTCSLCGTIGHNKATCDRRTTTSDGSSHLEEALNGLTQDQLAALADDTSPGTEQRQLQETAPDPLRDATESDEGDAENDEELNLNIDAMSVTLHPFSAAEIATMRQQTMLIRRGPAGKLWHHPSRLAFKSPQERHVIGYHDEDGNLCELNSSSRELANDLGFHYLNADGSVSASTRPRLLRPADATKTEEKEESKAEETKLCTLHNRGHNEQVLNFPGEQRIKVIKVAQLLLEAAAGIGELNDGNEDIAAELGRLFDQYYGELDILRLTVVYTNDLLELKGPGSKKEKKKKKGSGRLLTLLKNRDYSMGNSKLDDVNQFLRWAAENCIDFDEWKRLKDVAELRVDYFTEMKSFDHKTSISGLVDKVKEHAKGLATSNSETSKRAFFLGRAGHLLRKSDGGKTWVEVCDTLGEGLSQKSMANYEKYFVFVSKYPCFLRVKISYTGLLKYSTALTKHFKENPAVAAEWEDLECE